MMDHHANYATEAKTLSERATCFNAAAREMTVREYLDQHVANLERELKAVADLKQSLPGNYLDSGVSRIVPLFTRR